MTFIERKCWILTFKVGVEIPELNSTENKSEG